MSYSDYLPEISYNTYVLSIFPVKKVDGCVLKLIDNSTDKHTIIMSIPETLVTRAIPMEYLICNISRLEREYCSKM